VHTPELVLLGGPHSGKTHYAGQLYGRLRRRPGVMRLREAQGTPADLTALTDVLRCLGEGRAAEHTSVLSWAEVLLPLVDQHGNAMDLRWPDYGGEQLREVFKQRSVPEAWQKRLTNADGWVLLIRLKGVVTYPDALSELIKHPSERNEGAARADTWDDNAYWVELLQLLLHVAGLGTTERIRRPGLAVLLSCYDELEKDDVPPREVLAGALPLVSSFIQSNWADEAVSIWGLSALGRLLEKSSADETFIDDGPERQGWIVSPEGGQRDADLTKPLAWLLGAR
jgi:Double-GTPase 1